MAEPKSGRTYGSHVASAPGEAPAIDTGALASSIQVELNGLSAVVGTNQEQSALLEFGGVKVAARPAWEPAFGDAEPDFRRRLERIFE